MLKTAPNVSESEILNILQTNDFYLPETEISGQPDPALVAEVQRVCKLEVLMNIYSQVRIVTAAAIKLTTLLVYQARIFFACIKPVTARSFFVEDEELTGSQEMEYCVFQKQIRS